MAGISTDGAAGSGKGVRGAGLLPFVRELAVLGSGRGAPVLIQKTEYCNRYFA